MGLVIGLHISSFLKIHGWVRNAVPPTGEPQKKQAVSLPWHACLVPIFSYLKTYNSLPQQEFQVVVNKINSRITRRHRRATCLSFSGDALPLTLSIAFCKNRYTPAHHKYFGTT